MLRFHILTLFPGMFQGPFGESMLKRAQEQSLLSVRLYDIRDYAHDRHKTVDDSTYGGGPGMVMKPAPLFEAVEDIEAKVLQERGVPLRSVGSVVLLTPQGRVFNQRIARELASKEEIVLLCGHYEGVDERVRERLVDDELSIGDYVLTGGELAAMVVVDAVSRLAPGVLGDEASASEESHSEGLLEYPQYTRPPEYRGMKPPEVLLSGNHAEVARWRRQQSLLRTARRRPDLLAKASLTEKERAWLREQGHEV